MVSNGSTTPRPDPRSGARCPRTSGCATSWQPQRGPGILWGVADPADASFPCPCCGWIVFREEPGSYDVCPICEWEDDLSQLRFPTMGGANIPLVDAQAEFAEKVAWGTLDPSARGYRREPGWRLLDLLRDAVEAATRGRDYGMTYATDRTTYYYWRDAPDSP